MLDLEQLAESEELFDGHYKLLYPLSTEGATADIWLAIDTNTVDYDNHDLAEEDQGLKVAIKVYRPQNSLDIEKHLGGGWVAEETLAISLYCIHRYFPANLSQENLSFFFERAIIASVNHSGDSDSTGAVTGNIIGAITGYNAIPQFYKTYLEHHDVILKLSDDLCDI